MKVRQGFVSNSSSSSFIVSKDKLTADQLYAIRNFNEVAKKNNWVCDSVILQDGTWKEGVGYLDDGLWTIRETDTTISGNTVMGNFNMEAFFDLIGVPNKVANFRD